MTLEAYYFLNDPGCDWIDVEYETTAEEKQEIIEMIKEGLANDEYSIDGDQLEWLEDNLREVIHEQVCEDIENAFIENESVAECFGRVEMDTDELNELVHSGDQHAIDFFELQDLTDEELKKWDASDLYDIPDVCDFYEDFEPGDATECIGYSVGFYDIDLEHEDFLIGLLGEDEYRCIMENRDSEE